MSRKWYAGLLAVCLLSLALQIVGLASSPNGNEVSSELPVTLVLSSIAGLVGWVWGIVMAARNRQWVWLVLIVIFSILAAGIYAMVNLVSGSKTTHEVAE